MKDGIHQETLNFFGTKLSEYETDSGLTYRNNSMKNDYVKMKTKRLSCLKKIFFCKQAKVRKAFLLLEKEKNSHQRA